MYDVVVIGSGAAGMMAAISAAKNKNSVLLLEKLPKLAQKLKASGGGKCNVTNTLSKEDFMASFGRNGKFMREALEALNNEELISFLASIGAEVITLDKKRYFPKSKNSQTIIDALITTMQKLNVNIQKNSKVIDIIKNYKKVYEIHLKDRVELASNIIIATGGMGYKALGTSGDGFGFAKKFGHTISPLFPAMLPLHVRQTWVSNCKADTLAKVEISIDLPKYKKLKAKGDLIFTNNGIRGPVVLDFAREITPLLQKYKEVPLKLNLTGSLNEEQVREFIFTKAKRFPQKTIIELCEELLPQSVCKELCLLNEIDMSASLSQLPPQRRDALLKSFVQTSLHVISHDGFDKAMVTRGGVNLKEVDSKTMQSKLQKGLYFCGEVLDIDGPCGGFNLQWAFSSGFLAGNSIEC
jgi:predicted Rossmann fold flavoprotein